MTGTAGSPLSEVRMDIGQPGAVADSQRQGDEVISQFLAHTRYLLPRKVWPPLNLADLETYERLCQVAQLGLKR